MTSGLVAYWLALRSVEDSPIVLIRNADRWEGTTSEVKTALHWLSSRKSPYLSVGFSGRDFSRPLVSFWTAVYSENVALQRLSLRRISYDPFPVTAVDVSISLTELPVDFPCKTRQKHLKETEDDVIVPEV